MKVAIVAFFVLVFVPGTACASGGGKDRSVQNDRYTFSYPGNWREVNLAGAPGAAGSVASVAPKPFNGANLVNVSVIKTGVPITQTNLQVAKLQIAALYARTYGRVTKGPTSTAFHGLLAIRLETSGNPAGKATKAGLLLVFKGATVYSVQCQFTAEGAAEIRRGCAQVEKTLQIK